MFGLEISSKFDLIIFIDQLSLCVTGQWSIPVVVRVFISQSLDRAMIALSGFTAHIKNDIRSFASSLLNA